MSSATTSKTVVFGLHARFGSGLNRAEQKSKKANGGTCREGSQFISLRTFELPPNVAMLLLTSAADTHRVGFYADALP